jgi:beta-lactamase regulating signal transducer with metallopeptidase domain
MATGLALVAAGFSWFCRRPALNHCLWLLVLLKLITPPFWPVSLAWLVPAEPPSREACAAGREASPHTVTPEAEPAYIVAEVESTEEAEIAQTAFPSLVAESSGTAGPEQPEQVTSSGPGAGPITWQALAAGAWLSGAGVWFVIAGWRIVHFRRLLKYACPAGRDLQQQVEQLAQELGLARCPGVWIVPGTVSPMLWALGGKPRLLLPRLLFEQLSADQRATLLVHELAHLRRRDHWVRWLEFAATGLYWWHPVVWWARREIGIAEEECCDAWVVGTLPAAARDYALALMETVDFLSEVRTALPPAVSGIGHVQLLRRRLGMIMQGTTPKSASGLSVLALLALGLVVLPLKPTWAQSDARSKEPTDRKPEADQPIRVLVVDNPDKELVAEVIAVDGQGDVRVAPSSQEDARDQVEVLKAQLDVKRAELHEGEARLKQAQRRLERLRRLGTSVSATELANAQDEVELMSVQLEPKHAQIKEAEIRLHQASRRLASGQGAEGKPGQDVKKDGQRRTYRLEIQDEKGEKPARIQLEELKKAIKQSTTANQLSAEMQKKLADLAARAAAEKLATAEKAKAEAELSKLKTEEKAKAAEETAKKKLPIYIQRVEQERARAEDSYKKAMEAREAAARWEVKTAEGKDSDRAKIQALEQKLDVLAKEMEGLRKDIKALLPPATRSRTTPEPAPRR